MAFINSPALCETCQGIINSPEFRAFVEELQFKASEATRRHKTPHEDVQYREELRQDSDISRWDHRGIRNFMTYGDLVSSQERCNLCQLILKCRTSQHGWDGHRTSPDVRPSFEGVPAPDTKLNYLFYMSYFRMEICASLAIGTSREKLSLVQISLPTKQQIENSEGLLTNPHQPLRQTTISQIKAWVNECTTAKWTRSHNLCFIAESAEQYRTEPLKRPKRLLRIHNEKHVVVEELGTKPSRIKYVTLSHCWGPTEKAMLWQNTIISPEKVVDLHSAPRMLSETVALLYALNVPYVWVDALCIDQSSKSEWLEESAKMGDIYFNAYLNISAVGSKDGTEGLFHTVPFETKLLIPLRTSSGLVSVLLAAHSEASWNQQVQHALLSTRGWVLQERLLSPRILHMAHGEIFWECRTQRAAETGEKWLYESLDYKGSFSRLNFWKGLPRTDDMLRLRYNLWATLIEAYSRTNLTRASDKLIAVGGIASRFAQLLELSPASYMAGIWEADFPKNLLWHVQSGLCLPDRAPSWSWMRWDGSINVARFSRGSDVTCYAHVTSISPAHCDMPFVTAHPRCITLRSRLGVFNFTDVRKEKPAEQEKVKRSALGSSNNSYTDIFKIPAWEIDWDDEIPQAIRVEQKYYALFIASHTTARVWHRCEGLVLTPIQREKGRYERVGTFVVNVPSVESVLAYGMDKSKILEDAHLSFDPDHGFEIELV